MSVKLVPNYHGKEVVWSISCILKKKLSFKGHVYFQPVRPHKVRAALKYM